MKNVIEFINPDGLYKSPAFSQVAVVPGNHRTIYIGGQNSIDKNGNIVGKGSLEQQAQQILANIDLALQAAGASFEHVIKWNVYFVKGQSAQEGFKVFQPRLAKLSSPPLITGIFVDALARPDLLLEIEAIAAVPA